MSKALVPTVAAVARVLGVGRTAVVRAVAVGKIEPESSGEWDVVAALHNWRDSTHALLQRPDRQCQFRPWLNPETELSDYIWHEFCRRADAEGAEWVDDDDDDELTLPDVDEEDIDG